MAGTALLLLPVQTLVSFNNEKAWFCNGTENKEITLKNNTFQMCFPRNKKEFKELL